MHFVEYRWRSIIADPLRLPGMMVANAGRGDVVVPYDGNAGQVVGGVPFPIGIPEFGFSGLIYIDDCSFSHIFLHPRTQSAPSTHVVDATQ
jgi:hypothetical protein